MEHNSRNKLIASAVVIAAVVLVAFGASIISGNKSDASSSAGSDASLSESSAVTADTSAASQSATTPSSAAANYKNGTYSASESYLTPGGTEAITVTLSVANDRVTSVSVEQNASNHESADYQDRFAAKYKSKVVGKALSSLNLSRISGASDTTRGLNDALGAIRSKAQVQSEPF